MPPYAAWQVRLLDKHCTEDSCIVAGASRALKGAQKPLVRMLYSISEILQVLKDSHSDHEYPFLLVCDIRFNTYPIHTGTLLFLQPAFAQRLGIKSGKDRQ